MPEGPKNKPTNPGAGEIHKIKGSTPEQRKKDAETFARLLPGVENPYEKGAAKKQEASKKALAKLPGGKKAEGKEYVVKSLTPEQKAKQKKLMDELTGGIDTKNDRLANIKIAGEGMTAEEIAGKPAKKESKVANKSQKPKGNV